MGARGRSFGTSSANKTITGQLLGSKERSIKPTANSKQTPNTAILTDEEGNIDLLVEIAGPSSASLDEDAVEDAFTADFQRLKSVNRGGNSTTIKARFVVNLELFLNYQINITFSFFSSSPTTTDHRGNLKYNKKSSNSSSIVGGNSTISAHPIVIHNRGNVRHLGSRGREKSGSSKGSSGSSRFVNATLQIPARPPSVFGTPEPFSAATKCSEEVCRLPDCFCGGTEIPGKKKDF